MDFLQSYDNAVCSKSCGKHLNIEEKGRSQVTKSTSLSDCSLGMASLDDSFNHMLPHFLDPAFFLLESDGTRKSRSLRNKAGNDETYVTTSMQTIPSEPHMIP